MRRQVKTSRNVGRRQVRGKCDSENGERGPSEGNDSYLIRAKLIFNLESALTIFLHSWSSKLGAPEICRDKTIVHKFGLKRFRIR